MNDRPTNFLPAARRAVEDEIERLIGLLDGMDGDENLEPTLGFVGHGTGWTGEAIYDDDREDVSEDEGADIQAQPHDAIDEGNDEPTLGRLETIHQGAASYSGKGEVQDYPLHFDSDGYSIGKKLLKQIGADGFVHTSPALPIAEYREVVEAMPDGTVMHSIVSKMDGPPDLDGDWRALHYRAAHEGRTKTGESK